MNHALIQRNTHAVFSLLRIRAPIDDDQQIELRTKMRRVIELGSGSVWWSGPLQFLNQGKPLAQNSSDRRYCN